MKRLVSVRRIFVLFLVVFFAALYSGCGGDEPVKPKRRGPTAKQRTTNVKPKKPPVDEEKDEDIEELEDVDLEAEDTELEEEEA